MASPLVLLGAGALALLFLFGDDEEKKKKKKKKEEQSGGPLPSDPCIDAHMSPAMRATIKSTLSKITNPEVLENLANQASASGFPKAAACLQAAADELREQGQSTGVPPGGEPPGAPQSPQVPGIGDVPGLGDLLENLPGEIPSPGGALSSHTIRPGDTPWCLAVYYTGKGPRFKELEPLNPHLGTLKTVDGVSNYPGWQVGTSIQIPASWKYAAHPPQVPGMCLPSPLLGQV